MPLLALSLALSGLVPCTAFAAPADLDAQERQALAACQSGDAKSGVAILGRLYADTLEPAYVYNQGRCYQQNALPREALTRFREFLRLNRDASSEEAAKARSYIRELEAELQPAPQGTRRTGRVVGAAVAGVGLLGLGAGAYFGWQTSRKESALDRRLQTETITAEEYRLAERDGRRTQRWQLVGYGLGAAALIAGGATYLLSAPKSSAGPVAVRVTGRGLALEGTF